jgi:hypothetical protein
MSSDDKIASSDMMTEWMGVAAPDGCGMLNCRLTARLRIVFERIGNLKCQ